MLSSPAVYRARQEDILCGERRNDSNMVSGRWVWKGSYKAIVKMLYLLPLLCTAACALCRGVVMLPTALVVVGDNILRAKP